jgi:hypothetical protein
MSHTPEYNDENDFSSPIAEFEGTGHHVIFFLLHSEGGIVSTSTSFPSSTSNPAADAMDLDSPILSHIAVIASHAEETVRSITHDMDMSTVAYVVCRGLGYKPKSLLDLYHLNDLFVHVFEFATSTTVLGYLDSVALDRLEAACNSVRTSFFSLMSGRLA